MDEFKDGFGFAIRVFASLGHKVLPEELVPHLISVTQGEMTLSPSPEEAIREIEADSGAPMPQEHKDAVHQMLNGDGRRQHEEHMRHNAHRILASGLFGNVSEKS